ncbi:MAG TPA: choice-of-anchor D domain-containing protein, partial [Terriglobia bacterium]|nr:choice-of-anchor D domain-containing protein [Terriglobia bacterium]
MKNLKSHWFAVGLILVSLSSQALASSPNLPFGQTTTGTIASAAQVISYTFSANANDVIDMTMAATSGTLIPKIQLYSSAGKLLNTVYPQYSNGSCYPSSIIEMNTFLLTATDTYTVDVSDCSATNTGDYELYLQRTNNPSGAENLPFGGTPTAGTLSSAAQSNTYTFSANLNDEVDFTMTATTAGLIPKIRLYSESTGALISSAYPKYSNGACYSSSIIEMNTVQIPATGTYSVLLGDCGDTNTGNYEIYAQLTDNPSGAANLPFGQTQTGTIGTAAQSNTYTFSANDNDVVIFTMTGTTAGLIPKIRLYSSAGTLLNTVYPSYSNGACYASSTVEMNPFTLTQTGVYTVLVGDCADTNTGNYQLYAQRTNNPAGATTLLFGQTQTALIGSAAQSNTYTFSGTANDEVDFTMTGTTAGLIPKIRLYNESTGALLKTAYPSYSNGACYASSVIEMNTFQLPATGDYTVIVGDCADTSTGNYAIYAQRTNNPFGPAPLLWGSEVQTGTFASAAQSNTYSFVGSNGNVVDLTMTATSTSLIPKIRLYNPDGTQNSIAYPQYSNGACYPSSTIEMSSVTLAQTGTYTVLIGDCADTNTGNYNLSSQCFGTCPTMPAITWATPAAITYGTALGATQLDASANVAGAFVYSPVSGTVLTAGPQNLSVTFTPTDTTDYSTARDSVQLWVNKATPAITWPTPAPINYGTALSAAQLDATSPVAGKFVYSPVAGTVLPVGTQTLSVTFTPTDTTDYTTNTATVQLSVINPGATLSLTSEAFGNELINTASAIRKVTLTSTGTTNLIISSIAITGTNAGDFSQTNTCTAASYAPGAKCTISLKFTPSLLAAETASLVVTDNAANSPQSTALSGTGVLPVELSPTSLAFGNLGEGDTSAGKKITLTN